MEAGREQRPRRRPAILGEVGAFRRGSDGPRRYDRTSVGAGRRKEESDGRPSDRRHLDEAVGQ